jgi:hypothetical protein
VRSRAVTTQLNTRAEAAKQARRNPTASLPKSQPYARHPSLARSHNRHWIATESLDRHTRTHTRTPFTVIRPSNKSRAKQNESGERGPGTECGGKGPPHGGGEVPPGEDAAHRRREAAAAAAAAMMQWRVLVGGCSLQSPHSSHVSLRCAHCWR